MCDTTRVKPYKKAPGMPLKHDISKEGIDLIKEFEGCRLTAYRDAAGVLTIGWGHTSAAGAPQVIDGMTITAAQADDILRSDLQKFVDAVKNMVTVGLSQGEFDALVSFDFNTGSLASSTLLKRVNAQQFNLVPGQFLLWDHAGGQRLPGLTRRRIAEVALWNEAGDAAIVPSAGHVTVEMAPPVKKITHSKIAIGSVVTGITATAASVNSATDQINQATDAVKGSEGAVIDALKNIASLTAPLAHLSANVWLTLAAVSAVFAVVMIAERVRHLFEDRT